MRRVPGTAGSRQRSQGASGPGSVPVCGVKTRRVSRPPHTGRVPSLRVGPGVANVARASLFLEVPDRRRGGAGGRSPEVTRAWREDPRSDSPIITNCISSRSLCSCRLSGRTATSPKDVRSQVLLAGNHSPFKGCQFKCPRTCWVSFAGRWKFVRAPTRTRTRTRTRLFLSSVGVFITNQHEEGTPKMECQSNCPVVLPQWRVYHNCPSVWGAFYKLKGSFSF